MKVENSELSSKQDIKSEQVAETKFDPYESSLKFEEDEVNRRSEEEDQKTFASVVNHLKILMKEILQMKNEKPDESSAKIESHKVKSLLLMMTLRRLSRIQKSRVKDSRENSSDSRQEVDGITLLLQNLLYEVSHLKKEVRKCLEFKSADTEIDLVPMDQFYQEAPENISRPDQTKDDPHQQRLAQLHWELEQRRGQTQLSDKLNQEKEAIASIIDEQESKLDSLLPRINDILEATLPLQKALDLPLEEKKQQQNTSQYLPPPLYTLWVQLTSYAEACDSSLGVEIKGDLEAAKKFSSPQEDSKTAEESESENELDVHEEQNQRKGRARKEKKTQEVDESADAALKQLIILHPLHVEAIIKTKENDAAIISFFYVVNLRIVSIKCVLKLNDEKSSLSDILNGDNILNFLIPGDSGRDSPNPANVYQFQKLKQRFLAADLLQAIGKSYKWAQMLCGLSFMACDIPQEVTEEPGNKSNDSLSDDDVDDYQTEPEKPTNLAPTKTYSETLSWRLSVDNMHYLISAIRRRLQSRVSLQSQFHILETVQSTSSIPVPAESLRQLFPGKVSSELTSWKPLSWADYMNSRATAHLRECGVVNSDWLFFKAVYQRQSVTLEAFVAVSPDYANVPPVFGLLLFWNKDYTADTNQHVRQIENEVNIHCGELLLTRSDRYHLLSLQLYRLAMCLDILTEAASLKMDTDSSHSQKEFHKEKIFFRPNRGPDRALPYKYLPKLGVFAQR